MFSRERMFTMSSPRIYLPIAALVAAAALFACGEDATSPSPEPEYSEFTNEMVTPVYVDDAVTAFEEIPDRGLYLEAYTDNGFDYGWCIDCGHIQGVQRLRESDYLVLSSNDGEHPGARLALVHIASTPGDELLASNEGPPPGDRVFKLYLEFEAEWNHAGGMATCGDILAVPLENSSSSEIRLLFVPRGSPADLYDLSYKYPDAVIKRPDDKAGAVALTRFPTGPHKGQYLVAVLTDGHEGPLDFYLSRTKRIFDGFQRVARWYGVKDPVFHGNQNMDFVVQTDGTIFLIGTDNTNVQSGEDWAELYRVEFADESLADPKLTQITATHFYCGDHGDFDGGAGLYVNHDGKLALYTVEMFTSNLKLKLTEFGWTQDSPYWIEMYDDKGFKDRKLVLRGSTGNYLPNYHHVYAGGEWGYNDKVSSVRWFLPEGVTYLLYEQNSYGGRSLALTGTGKTEEYSDVGYFSDLASSSKFLSH